LRIGSGLPDQREADRLKEVEMEEAQAELKSDDWKKAKVNSTSAARVVAKLSTWTSQQRQAGASST
jgi:predicted membrane chloride channel (bestrophin family)